jgi:hypothetical protein
MRSDERVPGEAALNSVHHLAAIIEEQEATIERQRDEIAALRSHEIRIRIEIDDRRSP